jgi:hypothetical protein
VKRRVRAPRYVFVLLFLGTSINGVDSRAPREKFAASRLHLFLALARQVLLLERVFG